MHQQEKQEALIAGSMAAPGLEITDRADPLVRIRNRKQADDADPGCDGCKPGMVMGGAMYLTMPSSMSVVIGTTEAAFKWLPVLKWVD